MSELDKGVINMEIVFTKANMDHFFYLLAKDCKKNNKHISETEIILIGGSAILAGYNFRAQTTDIDAIIRSSSIIKEAANRIADQFGLSNNWLNSDFIKTKSYSPQIVSHSKFYKKFYGFLNVRIIMGEYLVAMKLRSARIYKHDLSDIIGIIKEQNEIGNSLTIEKIKDAYIELYNEPLTAEHIIYLSNIFQSDNIEDLFYDTIKTEDNNKKALLEAQEEYKDVINDENINSFIDHFSPNKGE